DTGGWYKICCPTSQLSKPDVLGAIYRVRRGGAPKADDSRGLRIEWEKLPAPELIKFLDDERPYVIKRAIHQLARGKGDSIIALSQVLKKGPSVKARCNAVWALTQIDAPEAREA